jgi:hypothetical protein
MVSTDALLVFYNTAGFPDSKDNRPQICIFTEELYTIEMELFQRDDQAEMPYPYFSIDYCILYMSPH